MGLLRWNKEFALEQAAEDADLLQELLDIFKDSFASDLQHIEDGIQNGDDGQVASAAHSIKGAAASLGMDGLTELVGGIESDSKAGNIDEARNNISKLQQMLAEVNTL